MARPLVTVRDATPDDLPALMAMWSELRELSSRYERTVPGPSEAGVFARLCEAHASPDVRIVVACLGDAVVGMAVLTHQPFAALFEARAVHVNYLHVRAGHRRRGVGHALVAVAASFAEEVGAEQVMTSVYPQLRDGQRFYARLGFAPVVVRRVATVATLRRHLARGWADDPAADRAGDRAGVRAGARAERVQGLLARRRSMRLRGPGAPGETITSP